MGAARSLIPEPSSRLAGPCFESQVLEALLGKRMKPAGEQFMRMWGRFLAWLKRCNVIEKIMLSVGCFPDTITYMYIYILDPYQGHGGLI